MLINCTTICERNFHFHLREEGENRTDFEWLIDIRTYIISSSFIRFQVKALVDLYYANYSERFGNGLVGVSER